MSKSNLNFTYDLDLELGDMLSYNLDSLSANMNLFSRNSVLCYIYSQFPCLPIALLHSLGALAPYLRQYVIFTFLLNLFSTLYSIS